MEIQYSGRRRMGNSKVRIIARIPDLPNQESRFCTGDSKRLVSVQKPGDGLDKFTVSFVDQQASRKDAYEVDHCYEKNEDIGLIYSREVNPQISRIFDGQKATFIAFGAKGSGKTYTIQGSQENPGFAMLAMGEILSIAEERKNFRVAVSFYEVFHDHVYDLLDVKHSEVQVLEDAQGRIILKGLSKVYVKSILQFQKLSYTDNSGLKPKTIPELPRRIHKGTMIRIYACEENSSPKLVGKMNFVDLAGYENGRRNSVDGTNLVETTRINKSLNALLNVIHAINANESHVPYRESKLTRMLQDSLGGTNYILLLTCLNLSLYQDTILAMGLASRSCQVIKPTPVSSHKTQRPLTASTTKKQTISKLPLSAKRNMSVVKGRRLFADVSKQALCPSDNCLANSEISDCTSAVAASSHDEVKYPSENVLTKSDMSDPTLTITKSSMEEEKSVSKIPLGTTLDDEVSKSSALLKIASSSMVEKDISPTKHVTPNTSSGTNATDLECGVLMGKENKSSLVNGSESPPLSTRLRDLSNQLKALCYATPVSIERPQEIHTPYSGQQGVVDNLEPKTPVITRHTSCSNKRGDEKFNTPLEQFSKRSSGMKQSFVQEYLQFLNTANKEDLKGLRGIGEKRATYILELREETPEPFKSLDDLQDIGLSAKQVKSIMKTVAGQLFS